MNDNRNLLIALFLCFIVLISWPYVMYQSDSPVPSAPVGGGPSSTGSASNQPPGGPYHYDKDHFSPRQGQALSTLHKEAADEAFMAKEAPRIVIRTPQLIGSFSLYGARLDDLSLDKYFTKPDHQGSVVRLFLPLKDRQPAFMLKSEQEKPGGVYFSEFGWVEGEGQEPMPLPDAKTLWSVDVAKMGQKEVKNIVLDSKHPVYLQWDNGKGLVFHRRIAVDDQFLFTIEDSIENHTSHAFALHAYGLIVRQMQPDEGSRILHEGMIGAFKTAGLKELKYSDLRKKGSETITDVDGWLGITDKYWASALIPMQDKPIKAQFKSRFDMEVAQADYVSEVLELIPNTTITYTHRLFAGAKIVSVINDYQAQLGIYRFDLMIDWGWFPFLTKPVFYILDAIGHVVKNFGIAILIMTVLIKLLFYPLSNKSYRSMNKMRSLAPEVERIRRTHKGDMTRQQQAIMALYRQNGVNPFSGCLPVLIQIPVFFALYKVLYGTIEMRHAPFFGWVHDLSAPDPTSLFNLFGLISWHIPNYLMIGIWPILLGLSMFLQQRLTPGSDDPIQKRIFVWLPLIFTVMLAQFPAGLVIYWTWNNILSIAQQIFLMRCHHLSSCSSLLMGKK